MSRLLNNQIEVNFYAKKLVSWVYLYLTRNYNLQLLVTVQFTIKYNLDFGNEVKCERKSLRERLINLDAQMKLIDKMKSR